MDTLQTLLTVFSFQEAILLLGCVLTPALALLATDKWPTPPLMFTGFRCLTGKKKVRHWLEQHSIDNSNCCLETVLIDESELLEQLGIEHLAQRATTVLKPHLEEYIDEVMNREFALLWENLPPLVKQRAYRRSELYLPEFADNLIEDMIQHARHLLSYRSILSKQIDQGILRAEDLSASSELFNPRWALTTTTSIAAVLAVIPVTFYALGIPLWLVFLMQFSTSWAALYLGFTWFSWPREPKQWGNIQFQSGFDQNMNNILEHYVETLTSKVLRIDYLVAHIFHHDHHSLCDKLVRKHLSPLLESTFTKVVIQCLFGFSGFLRLKKQLADKIIQLAPYPYEDRVYQNEHAATLKRTMLTRLKALPTRDARRLLLPYFEVQQAKAHLCYLLIAAASLAVQAYFLF